MFKAEGKKDHVTKLTQLAGRIPATRITKLHFWATRKKGHVTKLSQLVRKIPAANITKLHFLSYRAKRVTPRSLHNLQGKARQEK